MIGVPKAAESRYGGPFAIWDWPSDVIGWLDEHSGSMTVLVSAAAGMVAVYLAWLALKTLRATQQTIELERENARRATEPIIRGILGDVTDAHVRMRVRNVGLGPAVDVTLSARELEGTGVPAKGDYAGAIIPNEEAEFVLARLPPASAEARSEFDLVYSDARQSVVKRQLWVFYLAHDVVTMREFSHVVFETTWPELETPRERLIDAEGKVRLLARPARGPHQEDAVEDPGPLIEADTLSGAWLLKYGSYLTGSTMYLHVLRAIEEREGSRPEEE